MPTYEYLCQTCSHRFETWQKMSDEPLTTCPECGAHIRRVLYPAGVVFKGQGFYKTDYSKNGAKAEESASANGESKKSEGSEANGTNGAGKTENKGSSASNDGNNGKSSGESKPTESKSSSSESKPSTSPASK